jgi:hypothetical protein
MEPQLFTDGIGRITVIGGIVRLDMVTYSPNETDPQGHPRQIFTQRIVMGTEAFLRSSEKVVEIVQQLTGARQPKPAPAPQAPVQKTAPAPAQSRGEPPYTTGPLFPPTPAEPPKAPFP